MKECTETDRNYGNNQNRLLCLNQDFLFFFFRAKFIAVNPPNKEADGCTLPSQLRL